MVTHSDVEGVPVAVGDIVCWGPDPVRQGVWTVLYINEMRMPFARETGSGWATHVTCVLDWLAGWRPPGVDYSCEISRPLKYCRKLSPLEVLAWASQS